MGEERSLSFTEEGERGSRTRSPEAIGNKKKEPRVLPPHKRGKTRKDSSSLGKRRRRGTFPFRQRQGMSRISQSGLEVREKREFWMV